MSHPIPTAAALKRTLTPGTPVKIVNHVLPHISRTTTVHAKTNTVDLCTYATNREGRVVASHLRWPKAADFRPDPDNPNMVHIDKQGDPFLTLIILDDLADVPAEYRAVTA